MRHVITVVGSEAQRAEPPPDVRLKNDEALRRSTWFACANQEQPGELLDDTRGVFIRLLRTPALAYQFYLFVQSIKLWSGKRPLILIRGRSLSSRVAAYAARWGGGDVVKADDSDEPPLGPTRYVLSPDGKLQLHDG
jgi:hypothetical protein